MILLLRRSDRLPLEISEDFSVVDSALQWLTIKYFWMLTLANTPSLQRPETDKTRHQQGVMLQLLEVQKLCLRVSVKTAVADVFVPTARWPDV